MKQEAIDTRNKPRPDSINLGRWLLLLRLYGINTPVADLENKTIDDILAGLARGKERMKDEG